MDPQRWGTHSTSGVERPGVCPGPRRAHAWPDSGSLGWGPHIGPRTYGPGDSPQQQPTSWLWPAPFPPLAAGPPAQGVRSKSGPQAGGHREQPGVGVGAVQTERLRLGQRPRGWASGGAVDHSSEAMAPGSPRTTEQEPVQLRTIRGSGGGGLMASGGRLGTWAGPGVPPPCLGLTDFLLPWPSGTSLLLVSEAGAGRHLSLPHGLPARPAGLPTDPQAPPHSGTPTSPRPLTPPAPASALGTGALWVPHFPGP